MVRTQAPYGGGYAGAYATPGAPRMPSPGGYGTHATTSMRPTHESDLPPPSAYIQQQQHPAQGASGAQVTWVQVRVWTLGLNGPAGGSPRGA